MRLPKNFKKIPDWITARLDRIKKHTVVAACVRRIPVSDIRKMKFGHLDIFLKGLELEFPKVILPAPHIGRISKINAEGMEIVRKDLPKMTKYHSVTTPNWGDWSKGTHETDLPYEAYPREHIPPSENEISIQLIGKEAGTEDTYVVRFSVSEVMDRSKRNFKNRLLFNLNLLLENVGTADVFASDATLDEYLKTIYVNWEILPAGEREDNIARILKNVSDSPEIRAKLIDRYTFLERMKPEAFIQGHGGFKRYFGAKFSDTLVVFENIEYGNAIYAMLTNWVEQSKRTRQELLASGREGKDFIRVPHFKGWKHVVRDLISNKRKPLGRGDGHQGAT
jgi:hypothetical protein